MFTEDQYHRWDTFFNQLPISSYEPNSDEDDLPDPEMIDIRVNTYIRAISEFSSKFNSENVHNLPELCN